MLPPAINEANELWDVVFDTPKKNLASFKSFDLKPSIRFNPSFSLRLHLVFGKRSQSKSLVQVPEKYKD